MRGSDMDRLPARDWLRVASTLSLELYLSGDHSLCLSLCRTRLTPTVKAALSIMRIMKGLLRFSSRCNLKLFDGSPVTA